MNDIRYHENSVINDILEQWYKLRLSEQLNYHVEIGELVGKTLTDIVGAEENNDVIVFFCSDGTRYMMYHEQDCCESVDINDICGYVKSLIGTPITKAEDVSNAMVDAYPSGDDDYEGSHTWTFYHLATIKGYVTLRWFGSSNGYYSEEVSFVKLP